MLSWPSGLRPTDGCWAEAWYGNALKSTGFAPNRETPAQLPDERYLLIAVSRQGEPRELTQPRPDPLHPLPMPASVLRDRSRKLHHTLKARRCGHARVSLQRSLRLIGNLTVPYRGEAGRHRETTSGIALKMPALKYLGPNMLPLSVLK